MQSVTGAFDNLYEGAVRCSKCRTVCHREKDTMCGWGCMLLAAVGAEMTKWIQRTLLGSFKTVLHADQIEHIASIIWS